MSSSNSTYASHLISNCTYASELSGQSVYEQDMPPGFPLVTVRLLFKKDNNGESLVNTKDAFNLVMQNLGFILRVDPRSVKFSRLFLF